MINKISNFLRRIWDNKIVLFLVLTFFYAANALALHQLYKSGAFAVKHYWGNHYFFSVKKYESETDLRLKVRDSCDVDEPFVKKGDVIIMNEYDISYKDYKYTYNIASSGDHDYYVTFPDGKKYAFDKNNTNKCYIQTKYGEDLKKVDNSDTDSYHVSIYTSSELPDEKYSPRLIFEAITSYHKYIQEDYMCNTESEIFSITLPIWLIGTIMLCLMNQLLQWEMTKLQYRISIETTSYEQSLEPSRWRKVCHIAGCAGALFFSYGGMYYWYVHLH